ncbi:uncharacterized protein [Diabrotica undecimpunctata]|uniref:uncharacterized protein isoform X2 n=1 Tax=Diabrotica undecimpunctata TaxID=50387 RepID=UPI003B63C0F6
MDEIKEKNKYTEFKDINGNPINLHVQEISHCVKITIVNCRKGLYRKCIIIFIIASLDLICLVFNIFSINVIFTILCLVLMYLYSACNITTEESLVLIKDVGIEISSKQVVGVRKMFFPREQVQKIFINEVIFRNKVLFMLTLFVRDFKNNEKLVPLFTDILPQLAVLKIVYKHIRQQL